MKRFKSAGQAQRFLSVHDQVANLFRRPANITAAAHRVSRTQAFRVWAEVTGVPLASDLTIRDGQTYLAPSS
jgi:putative transposase